MNKSQTTIFQRFLDIKMLVRIPYIQNFGNYSDTIFADQKLVYAPVSYNIYMFFTLIFSVLYVNEQKYVLF